jgi:putative salt-induced outer membrane protein YdiY
MPFKVHWDNGWVDAGRFPCVVCAAMKKTRLYIVGLVLLCLGLWTHGALAATNDLESVPGPGSIPVAESNAPVVEPTVPATNPIPPAVVVPTPPTATRPVVRSSEMKEAFNGAGSSKFGIHGRVNNIPGKTEAKPSETGWRRSLELGVSTSRGNSDTLRLDGAISGSKETEENAYFLKVGGRYGESDEQKDTENAAGEAKAQRRLTERVYAAAEANAFHDQIADLAYRARGSLSLGRHFIWTERTVLNAEIGPGYVAEKKGGAADGFMAGRVAQYLEHLVTPSLQIWETVEYVPNLEDFTVYYVNASIGLETVLVSNLSLRFVVEDRYDNSPAEGKESNDLTTTTALAWSF